MAKKIPGWVWAIVIVILLCVVGIIAMAGAGLYFVSKQMRVESASPATAERQFESLREQLKGRQPLLEIDEDGDVVRNNIAEALQTAPASPPQLTTLHLVVWDSENEKLVTFDIPFWLMRLKRGPISVISETGHIRSHGLVLTVADLERLGPAVLIDHRDHRGTRVLAWTQ